MSEYILEMRNITKEFPGVRALKGVDLLVCPGTVHTLMGENGAGKSTLMKCLIGIQRPTSGEIIFNGKKVLFNAPIEALRSGISMIHQELSPVPERSVCENLWMGRIPKKGLIIDHKKMRADAISLFKKLGLNAYSVCILPPARYFSATLPNKTRHRAGAVCHCIAGAKALPEVCVLAKPLRQRCNWSINLHRRNWQPM